MIIKNKIIEAVKKINPNAEISVTEEDVNSIVWENGTTPIPVADIEAQIPIVEQEITDEIQAEKDNKANGNQKLLDLGLSQAEATALTGYTPPVADEE
jgi:hypothetical protein